MHTTIVIVFSNKMFKQSQFLSGDFFKPTHDCRTFAKSPPYLDNARPTSTNAANHQTENCTEQRFLEIKKKYGAKERTVTQPYESKALKEITLRASNYSSFRNNEDAASMEKPASSLSSKSIIIPSSSSKENAKYELPKRSSIRESIVKRVDESMIDIPRFGGRAAKYGVDVPSKSVQILPNQVKEERVGSIDKINMKIYQILNTLNENSTGKQFERSKLESQLRNQTAPRAETAEKVYRPEITKSKVYIETNSDAFSKYYVPGRASRRTEPLENCTRRLSTNPVLQSSKMKVSYLPEDSRKEGFSLKTRDIDEEIKKIQQRIKKSQQEKKRLDINFPEWKDVELPRRLSCYFKVPQNTNTLLERKNRLYGNITSFKLRTEENQRLPTSSIRNSQSLYTEEKLSSREMQITKNSSKLSISHNDGESSKTETRRFIQTLKRQVELDESLRNAKVVASHTGIKNKWSLVKQALEKQNITLSLSQVQSQFEVTLQQHNPFFSVRESTSSIEELVRKYCESYCHWTQNTKGKFNYEHLKKQGFCEQKIDMERKGFINIEDMVRFLNFETKSFYRNRDVILLFRRITAGSSIRFSELVEALCK